MTDICVLITENDQNYRQIRLSIDLSQQKAIKKTLISINASKH